MTKDNKPKHNAKESTDKPGFECSEELIKEINSNSEKQEDYLHRIRKQKEKRL